MTVPPHESRFWNEPLETMPRERLLAMQWKRVAAVLRYAYEKSPFYRSVFAKLGAEPGDFRDLAQFKKHFPKTDKKDFLHLQQESPMYGPTLAVDSHRVAMHTETSGSTGLKLHIPFTLYCTERYGESWVYGWWGLGIRPSDTFYFAFNWGLFAGFWSAYWGARRLGATVYPGGGQTTAGHIEQILRLKPTVLLTTPTYGIRLAEEAARMGVDLASSSVRFTYHAGEPGPCALPAIRRRLEQAWGATAGELLGLAEVDALAPGCPLGHGVHVNELNVFSWSCDPDDPEREVEDGEVGENVVTSFVQNAQPLINYRTHDLVRARSRCDCGRTWRYFDGCVLGRSDHMITIKGTNVYPGAIEIMLTETPGLSSHYEIVLDRPESGMDEMSVRAEADPEVAADDYAALAARLEQRLRAAFDVRLPVTILAPQSLPRYELKAKRVVDNRRAEVRRALDR